MVEVIITSSVLILVIIALRFILRGKISLRLQYALWVLVAIRLLVPFSLFSSPVSVMNVVPDISSGIVAETPTDNLDTGNAYNPIAPDNVGENIPAVSEGNTNLSGAGGNNASINTPEPQTPLAVMDILRIIWLAGTGIFAFCFILSNTVFYIRLKRRAEPVGVAGCPIPVYWAAKLPSPCLFGLFRPSIYLTPESFESDNRLHYIVTHELTHRRHLDHIWSLIRGICLIVHWFNPLVWLAAILSKRDCELACDEGALLKLGEDSRIDYGKTLISMMTAKNAPTSLLCSATTMTGGKRGIKERIILIAKKPKMLATTLIAVLVIAAVAMGCTFTGAKKEGSPDDVTLYDCGDYSVHIPSEYVDQLIVYTWDAPYDDMTLISVYEKASIEAALEDGIDDPGLGWIFSIVRYDRVDYEQYLRGDGSGLYFFAKDADWYYGHSYATDIRYYRSGGASLDEAEQTQLDILSNDMRLLVRNDFTQRNSLMPYSDDEARLEYTYNSEHQFLTYYPHYSVYGSKDNAYTIVLSQPATQGEGGIWCVERLIDINGNVYLWFPYSGVPALDYYASVQAEHDAGERSDHADAYSIAVKFINTARFFDSFAIDGSLVPAENSYDDLYQQAWIYELFDLTGGIDIGLTIGGDTVYDTYSVADRAYAERFDVMMSAYIWIPTSEESYTEHLKLLTEAPYYVTLQSTGAGLLSSFTFFADSNFVLYNKGGTSVWYEVTYKYEDDIALSTTIRYAYDSHAINYTNIMFNYSASPDEVAELFVHEMYGAYMLNRAPGGLATVTDYTVVDWRVTEVSEDETALVGQFKYAVVPENYNSPGLWAGNTTDGEGEYEGWLVMSREFVLQKQDDGYWHCIGLGTGGYTLP